MAGNMLDVPSGWNDPMQEAEMPVDQSRVSRIMEAGLAFAGMVCSGLHNGGAIAPVAYFDGNRPDADRPHTPFRMGQTATSGYDSDYVFGKRL